MTKSMKSKILEKIGNKNYLKIEILQKDLENGLSKYAIKAKYGLGSKVIENTWKLAKKEFPELAKKVSREAHAKHMLGNKKGSKPPSIIISKDEILKAFKKRSSLKEILEQFKISEFLFIRNILYHNIKSKYTQFKDIPMKHILMKDNIIELIKHIDPEFLDTLEQVKTNSGNVKKIHEMFLELIDLIQAIKNIGRYFSKKHNSKLVFSNNLGCNNLCSYLYENNIEFKQEFKIDNYYFDFYLPTFNLLVEVDGSSHKYKKIKIKDEIKEKTALSKGFELVRIKWTGKTLYYEELHKVIQDKINKISRTPSSI